MTLLIDADWLIYSACAACEHDIRWDEWTHTLHLEEGDVKDYIADRIDHWRAITEHRAVVLCFSDYPTFRHTVFQDYKANRIGKRKPLGLRDIRLWAECTYESRTAIGLEADDLMGVFATGGYYSHPIVVTIDKDLRTVPCQLMAGEGIEMIDRAMANKTWMLQTLTGDSTDGYHGLKGCGPVKAEKILEEATTLAEMWDCVVAAYKKGGMTYADALRNARLSRILRHGDYSFESSDVRLWDPDADPEMKLES